MSGYHTLVLNKNFLPTSILPLSVCDWYESIKMQYLNTVTVLNTYENWVVHSPSVSIAVPSVIMLNKYVSQDFTVNFNRYTIYLRDMYTCQYCGTCYKNDKNALSLDHVIPRFYGGKNTFENVVCACKYCNEYKGHSTDLQPITKPKKPTYYQLINNRKKFPIVIGDESWKDYLDWPDHLYRLHERVKS